MKEPDMEAFTSVKGEWGTAGLKYVSDCMVEGIAPREALKSYLTVFMHSIQQAVLERNESKIKKTTEQIMYSMVIYELIKINNFLPGINPGFFSI